MNLFSKEKEKEDEEENYHDSNKIPAKESLNQFCRRF